MIVLAVVMIISILVLAGIIYLCWRHRKTIGNVLLCNFFVSRPQQRTITEDDRIPRNPLGNLNYYPQTAAYPPENTGIGYPVHPTPQPSAPRADNPPTYDDAIKTASHC